MKIRTAAITALMTIRTVALATLLMAWGTAEASAQRLHGGLIVGASQSEYERQVWAATLPEIGAGHGWHSAAPAGATPLLRPTLGVVGAVQVLGPLWLRGEALAVTKGYEGARTSRRALYLEVPLLAEVVLPWRGDVQLRAHAGIAPSAQVSCSAHVRLPYGSMTWFGPPVDYPVACGSEARQHDTGRVYGGGFGPLEIAGFTVTPELRLVSGRYAGAGVEFAPVEGASRARHRTWSLLLTLSKG